MKAIIITVLLFIFSISSYSQIGLGLVGAFDGYQRYANPIDPDDGTKSNSAGFIGGFGFGPKIWVGSEKFSLSVEGQVNYGVWGYSFGDDKGHGIISFPMVAKLNRKAASGFYNQKGLGISLGGGIQYNRTEVFRDPDVYPDLQRKIFPTYIGELGLHVTEGDGTDFAFYLRLGYNDREARSLNLGIVISINAID